MRRTKSAFCTELRQWKGRRWVHCPSLTAGERDGSWLTVLHVEGTKGGHDDGLPKAVRPGDTSQLRLTKTERLTRRALLVARPGT
jgi:hypothetical protein